MTINFVDHKSAIPALLEGLAIAFLLFNFSYLAFAGLSITLCVVLVHRYIIKKITGPTPGAVQGRAEVVVSADDYFKQLQNPKAVLITGAAQGVGFSLAKQYLTKKAESLQTLIMLDLKEEQLQTSAQQLAEFNPNNKVRIITQSCDVTDRAKMHDLLTQFHDQYNLDVVIANAGVSPFGLTHLEFEAQNHLVTDVNVHGVLNTVLPLHNAFRRAGAHGDVKQFLLVSSGTSVLPITASPYTGSKAFVTMWGRALRQELATWNVSVVIANPAWIETAMVADVRKRTTVPWPLGTDDATKRMLEACDIDEGTYIDPPTKYIPMFMFGTSLGYKMWDWLASKMKRNPYYADADVSTPPQLSCQQQAGGAVKDKVAKQE